MEMAIYAIVEGGVVINTTVWDGNTENWAPQEAQLAVLVPAGVPVSIGIKYTEKGFELVAPGKIAELVASPEDILQNNTVAREGRLLAAAQAIAPLMLALQLGNATDEEATSAKAWQAYARNLKEIDLTLESPPWPEQPT